MLVLLSFLWLLVCPDARAHSWMIRHGYTNCTECHLDPSGGGLLTEYGRGQDSILLTMAYGERTPDWEPGAEKDFLWGAVPLPEWLVLGGSSRSAALNSDGIRRFIQMQADLRAQVRAGPVRGYGSVALAEEGARGALITSMPDMNIVSREHWLGVDVGNSVLVRAGRMPLPFGLRVDEHVLLTRQATQVDINDTQQHGVAVAYNHGAVRTEVMGILGNLQLSPDQFRERGATGYFEYALAQKAAIGVSGLYGHANMDPDFLVERTRQAYGLFGRVAPVEPIVVYLEGDLLLEDRGTSTLSGHTGFLSVDGRILPGLHVKGTGEWVALDDTLTEGAWLTGLWYFAPHADLRLDFIERVGDVPERLGLAQLHFYL